MLHVMVTSAQDAGFKVQPEKTYGPARTLEFLGVNIDTVAGHGLLIECKKYWSCSARGVVRSYVQNASCSP